MAYHEDDDLAPAALVQKDGCQLCLGAKGGVRGNENVYRDAAGQPLVVCDYCSVLVDRILAGAKHRHQGMHRMWINQPSTLQPDHALHGARVLVAVADWDSGAPAVRASFTRGTTVSQMVLRASLSMGWPKEAV